MHREAFLERDVIRTTRYSFKPWVRRDWMGGRADEMLRSGRRAKRRANRGEAQNEETVTNPKTCAKGTDTRCFEFRHLRRRRTRSPVCHCVSPPYGRQWYFFCLGAQRALWALGAPRALGAAGAAKGWGCTRAWNREHDGSHRVCWGGGCGWRSGGDSNPHYVRNRGGHRPGRREPHHRERR